MHFVVSPHRLRHKWEAGTSGAGFSLTTALVAGLPFAHAARGALAAGRWAARAAAWNNMVKYLVGVKAN